MEYLGDREFLCPAQEYVADLADIGERRARRMWKVKENLLTWLGASGWSRGSVSGAEHLHERAPWSPEIVVCLGIGGGFMG